MPKATSSEEWPERELQSYKYLDDCRAVCRESTYAPRTVRAVSKPHTDLTVQDENLAGLRGLNITLTDHWLTLSGANSGMTHRR